MALYIKNSEVEALATEIAARTGESKTEAIRKALLERKERLAFRISHDHRRVRLQQFLEEEIWNDIPAHLLGKTMSKEERERILGYGPEGV